MRSKRSIKDRIQQDIYNIWDNEVNGLEKARDMLKKMYMGEFNFLTDVEDKRLILHDLTTAEIKIGTESSISSARLYSKTLLKILDEYPNYNSTQENKQKYCRALNNYTECHREEMSKEELIKVYEFCYDTYKRCDKYNVCGYLEKLIAEFNLNLLKRNFKLVLKVVEDILHNNQNSQYKEALDSFVEYIKNTDNILYKQALLLMQNTQIIITK